MKRLAALLGCTEGQAYTLLIGAVLSLATAAVGIPPTLRGGGGELARAGRPAAAQPPGEMPAEPAPEAEPVPVPEPARPGPPLGLALPTAAPSRPSPAPEPAPPGPVRVEPVDPALRVAASGWAAATGGLGVQDPSVPEGGLPVEMRLGRETMRSFLRLSGQGTTLRLRLAPEPEASQLPELARVRLCPVTEPWEPAAGMAMEDAPAFDCDAAVRGLVDETGVSFALGMFPDRAGPLGFALVADPEPLSTFRVTYRSDDPDQ